MKSLLLYIIFFICFTIKAQENNAITYLNDSKILRIGPKLEVYEDSTNTMTINQVNNLNTFKNYHKTIPNFGLSQSTFWAKFNIKNKKRKLHSLLMKFAIGLSLVFLVMYVAYHMTSESTAFGGEGTIRYIYFTILISHILLSITVIPFVLVTYVRAITNDIEAHKKIAKITFPLWLYVAVTGVVVYIMISPYY